MSSTFNDTVFDFDLNLLNQPKSNSTQTSLQQKYEKQRKVLITLKKKIVATDTLIGKFYLKKDALDDAEKAIVSLKEQCKQLRIEYNNSLEQKAELENRLQLLQNEYKKLEESCFTFKTQYEAQSAYAHQLKTLLNEKDTRIESLRIEKKLDNSVSKDNSKKQSVLAKTNETLLKDVTQFANFVKKYLAQKKLKPKYKTLLRKYTSNDGNVSDWTEDSDIEDDIFEESLLSPSEIKTNNKDKKSSSEEVDEDNHEFISLDTGRGSSLALDNLQSPGYFSNDSPSNEENVELKTRHVDVGTATSPEMFTNTVERAISPIIFSDTVEIATSPVKSSDRVEIGTSPIKFKEQDNTISTDRFAINKNTLNVQEKTCLELNSSKNVQCHQENDYEVGNILDTMKLNFKPLSPIPRTPSITRATLGSIANKRIKLKNCEELCEYFALQLLIAKGWETQPNGIDIAPPNFYHPGQDETFSLNLPTIEEENLDPIVNNVAISSKPIQKSAESLITPRRKRKREEKDSAAKSMESPKQKTRKNKQNNETLNYQTPKKQCKSHVNKSAKKSTSRQRSRLFSIDDDTIVSPKATDSPCGKLNICHSKQLNSSSEESIGNANSIDPVDNNITLTQKQNKTSFEPTIVTNTKWVGPIKDCIIKLTKTPVKEMQKTARTPKTSESQDDKEITDSNDETPIKRDKVNLFDKIMPRRSRLFSTEDTPEPSKTIDSSDAVAHAPALERLITPEEQTISSEEPIVVVVTEEESDPVIDKVSFSPKSALKSFKSSIITRRKSKSIEQENDFMIKTTQMSNSISTPKISETLENREDNETFNKQVSHVNNTETKSKRILKSRLFSTEDIAEPIKSTDPPNAVAKALLEKIPVSPSEEPLVIVVTEKEEEFAQLNNSVALSPKSAQKPNELSITTRSKSKTVEHENDYIVKMTETPNTVNKSGTIPTRVLRSRLFSTEDITGTVKVIDCTNELSSFTKERSSCSEDSEVYTNIKIIIEEEDPVVNNVTLSPKSALKPADLTVITRRKSKSIEQQENVCVVKTTETSNTTNKTDTSPTRFLRSRLFSTEDTTGTLKACSEDSEVYTNMKITTEDFDPVMDSINLSPKSAKSSPKSSIITRRKSKNFEQENDSTDQLKEVPKVVSSPKVPETPDNKRDNESYSYPVPRKQRISHYNTVKPAVAKRTPQKSRQPNIKNKIKTLKGRPNVTNVAQSKNRKLNSSPEKLVVDTNSAMTDEEEFDPIINTLSPKPDHYFSDPLIGIEKTANVEQVKECIVKLTKVPNITSPVKLSEAQYDKENDEKLNDQRKRRKSNSVSESDTIPKRTLRSSHQSCTEGTIKSVQATDESIESFHANQITSANTLSLDVSMENIQNQKLDRQHSNGVSYKDLDMFSTEESTVINRTSPPSNLSTCHLKESILCHMIEKYGVKSVRNYNKILPENKVKSICEKLENDINEIKELPAPDTKQAMDKLVADLQKLDYKYFTAGLIRYFSNKERKNELYGKVFSPPAPPMTKPEQILLYVITHLQGLWSSVDIVDAVLSNMEYTLFKLSRTPDFEIIESMAHFYAILCRYFRAKSRLRMFILDAMYCIQYKSVALIKQCLEVWMHIIPLAHMGIAKTPLVTCMIYLLHFYKCEDKYQRVQEIRNILNRKYNYQITDWNEKRILDLFETSIRDLKDIQIEKKMLRLALIILAKRNGAQWCQNNIIKKMIMPMIEKENTPHHVKEFCIRMIGPLMKPYPVDMKVHCEIIMNQLTDILQSEPSRQLEEAIITSMMFINRHDQIRIDQLLLTRKMKQMSPELEGIIRDYVRSKPLKLWKKNLGKMAKRSD